MCGKSLHTPVQELLMLFPQGGRCDSGQVQECMCYFFSTLPCASWKLIAWLNSINLYCRVIYHATFSQLGHHCQQSCVHPCLLKQLAAAPALPFWDQLQWAIPSPGIQTVKRWFFLRNHSKYEFFKVCECYKYRFIGLFGTHTTGTKWAIDPKNKLFYEYIRLTVKNFCYGICWGLPIF